MRFWILVLMLLCGIISQELTSDDIIFKKEFESKSLEGTPFEASVWNACWNGEYFDFTQSEWERLSNEKKAEYAGEYQKWYAKKKNENVEKEIYAGGSTFRMVLIPPGRYWMGSPEGEKKRRSNEVRHKVIISKGFWLGKYEVTQKQWYEVTGEKPWDGKEYGENNEKHAATYISWKDVEGKFLGKLGKGYGFPTEGQWEYACRGGIDGRFYWGEDENKITDYSNAYFEDGYKRVAPIGSFKGNAYGLHDMIGNVWEWCEDKYGDYDVEKERDPIGVSNDSDRVLRGGSWYYYGLRYFRSAIRNGSSPDERNDDYDFGFRLFQAEN